MKSIRRLFLVIRYKSEEGVDGVHHFPVMEVRTWRVKRQDKGMDSHLAVASYVGSHNPLVQVRHDAGVH